MKLVHDIIRGAGKGGKVIISFIQHGTSEDGWKYENICPFCATTVGYVEDKDDMLSKEQLFKQLQHQMSFHIEVCTAGGFKLAVQKTTKPLGVDKLIKEI